MTVTGGPPYVTSVTWRTSLKIRRKRRRVGVTL